MILPQRRITWVVFLVVAGVCHTLAALGTYQTPAQEPSKKAASDKTEAPPPARARDEAGPVLGAGAQPVTLRGHKHYVASVAYAPDGRTLASGSDDHTVRLWEAASGKELQVLRGHEGPVQFVAFSPDGQLLASGSDDTTVRLWEVRTGKALRVLRGHKASVWSVAFSPDGKSVASASWDRTVRLWDVATGETIRTLAGHGSHVRSVGFSPDGKMLVSGSEDGTVRLWEVNTGKEIRVIRGTRQWVASVAFSPSGQVLAFGSGDKAIHLWEVRTNQEIMAIPGQAETVLSLAFTPDGSFLVSAGGKDQIVHVWELATGQEALPLRGHDGLVRAIAVSPDGRALASGSWDATIKIWPLTYGKQGPDRPERKIEPAEWEKLWADLASAEAPRAYRAIRVLSAVPKQAVPLLGERLKPAAPADPPQIAALITALDSDQFAERENASQELARLGPSARPALEQVLAKPPSLEVSRRVERLLENLAEMQLAPDELRAGRAIELLEHIGTREAQEVLQRLVRGASVARQTQEVKAALARLAQRQAILP